MKLYNLKDQEANIEKSLDWMDNNLRDPNAKANEPWQQDLLDLTHDVKHLEVPAFDHDALFDRIQKEKVQDKIRPQKNVLKLIFIGCLLLASFFILKYILSESSIYKTQSKEYLAEVLPDGSAVKLNANSEIILSEDFANTRLLRLEGEAYFDVKPGSKFKIETVYGDVEVLGTSFSVNTRGKGLLVKVKSGKVSVSNQKTYILTKNQRIRIDSDGVTRDSLDMQSLGNWESNNFTYTQSTLSQVISDLTSWYGLQLDDSQRIPPSSFTGSFVKDDIDKALDMVLSSFGLEYVIEEDTLSIKE